MIPAASNALQDGQVDLSRDCEDPVDFTGNYNSLRWDCLFGRYPAFNEILALIQGRVSSYTYGQTYICLAGLNIGDPVTITGNNTVSLSLSTTDVLKRAIGFVRSKPTATSCMIEHYKYVNGMVGGTAGNPIYLQDDGSLGSLPGTKTKVLGTYISTSEALLQADPTTCQG